MPVGELCIRQVVVAPRKASVLEAAKLMRQYHVGDIVVTDEIDGRRAPVGIVTDRDMVLEVLAQELDATSLTVGDIMAGDLITVRENEGVFQTIQLMRANPDISQVCRTGRIWSLDGLKPGILGCSEK